MSVFEPAVSVALVTRNRPESLCRALASLRSQSIQPFEVIVSDDSSEKFYQDRNKEAAKYYNCIYLQGPARGLYANRNHVALACKGTHVRTMDDDHVLPEDHCKVVQSWVRSFPKDVLVMGEFSSACPVDSDVVTIPGQLHPRGFSLPPKKREEYYGISCGSSVYPKKVFDLGYRLCEDFLFGSAYLEFGSLLKMKGIKIRHLYDASVMHYCEPSDFRRNDIVFPSIFFSIICHSWYYQPSFQNKSLSLLQMFIFLLKRREKFFNDLSQGIYAATKRKNQVSGLPSLCG